MSSGVGRGMLYYWAGAAVRYAVFDLEEADLHGAYPFESLSSELLESHWYVKSTVDVVGMGYARSHLVVHVFACPILE